jgi:hypothetical protein
MINKITLTVTTLLAVYLLYDSFKTSLKYTWKSFPAWRKWIICVLIFAYISLLTLCVIKLWMV